MRRRIYIASQSMSKEEAQEAAVARNCPEFLMSIPPYLEGKVNEKDLPCVFEEPEAPPVSERDLMAEINTLFTIFNSLATSVNTLANELSDMKAEIAALKK